MPVFNIIGLFIGHIHLQQIVGSLRQQFEQFGSLMLDRMGVRVMWLQWGRVIANAEGSSRQIQTSFGASLQWDRVISNAEGQATEADRLTISMLQWGRVISNAEGSLAVASHPSA